MSEKTQVHLRLSDDLASWLETRTELTASQSSLSAEVVQELNMWRMAQSVELKRVGFTVAEASCLADIHNGVIVLQGLGHMVAAGLMDVMQQYDPNNPLDESYGARWDVDERALLAKAMKLSTVGDYALACALAEWWSEQKPATADGFRSVGIRILDGASEDSDSE
ncbi:MAG: hypothetical protein ACYCS4_08020 [Acidimicrobiales bacterium]